MFLSNNHRRQLASEDATKNRILTMAILLRTSSNPAKENLNSPTVNAVAKQPENPSRKTNGLKIKLCVVKIEAMPQHG